MQGLGINIFLSPEGRNNTGYAGCIYQPGIAVFKNVLLNPSYFFTMSEDIRRQQFQFFAAWWKPQNSKYPKINPPTMAPIIQPAFLFLSMEVLSDIFSGLYFSSL